MDIVPFLIGAYHIWKMRAIYYLFDGIHLPENEAAWVNSELKKMAFTAIRRRNS